jgi:hypothetical protein
VQANASGAGRLRQVKRGHALQAGVDALVRNASSPTK